MNKEREKQAIMFIDKNTRSIAFEIVAEYKKYFDTIDILNNDYDELADYFQKYNFQDVYDAESRYLVGVQDDVFGSHNKFIQIVDKHIKEQFGEEIEIDYKQLAMYDIIDGFQRKLIDKKVHKSLQDNIYSKLDMFSYENNGVFFVNDKLDIVLTTDFSPITNQQDRKEILKEYRSSTLKVSISDLLDKYESLDQEDKPKKKNKSSKRKTI